MSDGTKSMGPAVWAGIALALAGIVVAAWQLGGRAAAPAADGPARPDVETPAAPSTGILAASPGTLPDLPCEERGGKMSRTSELLGKWVVADFVFINCGATCPELTQKMGELQARTATDASLALVSFTVDPQEDTPERLAKYADKAGADPARWFFVRTSGDDIVKIAYGAFKMGNPSAAIAHSNAFILLDPDGRMRAHYQPLLDPSWMETLLRDLAKLRAEPR